MTDNLISSVRNLVQNNKDLLDAYSHLKNQCNEYQTRIIALEEQLNNKNINSDYMLVTMRLRKMGLRNFNMKNIFKIGTTLLSGGFVLQTILGEYWHTDLDIFTTNPKEVINELTKYCVWVTKPEILSSSYNSYNSSNKMKNVYRGEIIKGVFIDIIECANPIENINNFDFDFCKCYFDGSFHIVNPESILNKTCTVSYDKTSDKTLNLRINKYKLRGFIINLHNKPNNTNVPEKNNTENVTTLIDKNIDYCGGC